MAAWAGAMVAAGLLLAGCRTGSPPPAAAVPVLRIPHTAVAPVVDGNLDEPAWARAAVISGLRESRGGHEQDRIDRLPTTIRVLWDENYLYVGFACTGTDLFMSGQLKHDDDLYKENTCEVFLDGKGDGRQIVEVQANAAGVNLDMLHLFTGEPEYTPDLRMTQEFCDRERWKLREWEMEGLRTAGAVVRRDGVVTGWRIEMAIPAAAVVKRCGLDHFAPMELRANFIRYDWPRDPVTGKREMLHMNWAPVLRGCPHISPPAMGRLILLPD